MDKSKLKGIGLGVILCIAFGLVVNGVMAGSIEHEWFWTPYINDSSGNTAVDVDSKEMLGTWSGGNWPENSLGFNVANQTELDTHTGNTSNPHSVTWSQTGGMNGSACPDGEVRVYNATSGAWECNATASGAADGYLPDDPATSDVNMNNYNVTGVNQLNAEESVQDTCQVNSSITNGTQEIYDDTTKTMYFDNWNKSNGDMGFTWSSTGVGTKVTNVTLDDQGNLELTYGGDAVGQASGAYSVKVDYNSTSSEYVTYYNNNTVIYNGSDIGAVLNDTMDVIDGVYMFMPMTVNDWDECATNFDSQPGNYIFQGSGQGTTVFKAKANIGNQMIKVNGTDIVMFRGIEIDGNASGQTNTDLINNSNTNPLTVWNADTVILNEMYIHDTAEDCINSVGEVATDDDIKIFMAINSRFENAYSTGDDTTEAHIWVQDVDVVYALNSYFINATDNAIGNSGTEQVFFEGCVLHDVFGTSPGNGLRSFTFNSNTITGNNPTAIRITSAGGTWQNITLTLNNNRVYDITDPEGTNMGFVYIETGMKIASLYASSNVLNFGGNASNGFDVHADSVSLSNNEIYEPVRDGIDISYIGRGTISNNNIYNVNADNDTDDAGIKVWGESDDFHTNNLTITGNTIIDNRASHYMRNGIRIAHADYAKNLIVTSNIIRGTTDVGGEGYGIWVDTENGIFTNNQITDTPGGCIVERSGADYNIIAQNICVNTGGITTDGANTINTTNIIR